MAGPRPGRAAIFLPPLIIAFVAAQRAAANMRTVDFLTVFGAGMVCGVSLMRLIPLLRSSRGAGV
jgi:hypothetical protein